MLLPIDRSLLIRPLFQGGHRFASSDGSRVVGERSADDTGGGIRGAHIDHFSGAGSAATREWQASGGDLQNARVKFLGY
ncbi:3D domain-containing protein [Paraburkholderia sp. UYCP14C]|uniref:3D domain-containing protein n=1 Tax=Paraburkholderia sp. UYCP14C TaxID=2511130 RepID=UPI0035A01675